MMINIKKTMNKYWDEGAVYLFTVLCVFLGDYILHKVPPEIGTLPFLSAIVISALICLAVDLLSGKVDTEEKKEAKKRNLPKRLLMSGLAGIASSAVVPAMVKTFMASIGIEV